MVQRRIFNFYKQQINMPNLSFDRAKQIIALKHGYYSWEALIKGSNLVADIHYKEVAELMADPHKL